MSESTETIRTQIVEPQQHDQHAALMALAALEAELARTRGEKESLQRGLRWVAGMLTGDPEATEMEVYVALRAALKEPKDVPERLCANGNLDDGHDHVGIACVDRGHTQTQEPTERSTG